MKLSSANRDVLLQDIVSSLTENLVHFYPKDAATTLNADEPSPVVRETWSRAAAQYAASATQYVDGVDSTTNNLDDLVQEAMQLAMEKWKTQCDLKPATKQEDEPMKKLAPTSFSLLDQFTLGGGGLAAAFFAWDNVRELEPFEQIKALQGVQYLEDVLPDWPQVQTHLQQGLLLESSSRRSDEYLELHRKWFGWSRKSNETETAQLSIDLMVNVFQAMLTPPPPPPPPPPQAVEAAVDTLAGNETQIKGIIKLWWEMWMDLMIRGGGGGGRSTGQGGGGDSRLTSIVQTIWTWIPSPPRSNSGEGIMHSSSSWSERDGLLFRLLMEIDPCAKWAYGWARIHPSWTAPSIVLQAMNVSAVLVPWVCHYYCRNTSTVTTTLGQEQQRQQQHDHENYSCFICVVSLLRSILVSCRVAQFPWHLFEESLGQRSDVVIALQNLFLQGLRQQSQEQGPEEAENIRICIEGMEVLLSGCQNGDDDNKALYTKLVCNVESFVADKKDGRENEARREALHEMLRRHLF